MRVTPCAAGPCAAVWAWRIMASPAAPAPRSLRHTLGQRIDACAEAIDVVTTMRDPRVLASLLPSALRALLLRCTGDASQESLPARHKVVFDWAYPADFPAMEELYARAKQGQWDAASLAWNTSVDPLSPEKRLLPYDFIDWELLKASGIRLTEHEKTKLLADLCVWMLSQFLHGEQGALFAALQVTEAVPFFDGKFYGATQVMDEARHVEVYRRYLETKLHKRYEVNDNLYTIIDALMVDSRWDMKFLGMQIMVEGLALGAFGMLFRLTEEPLLKDVVRRVILDEARHVHYGVLALREKFTKHLSDRERREREEWAFEVALLMRNRFYAMEVYEEWFEGRMSRATWREFTARSKGMSEFRRTMFRRLVPNLRAIGLLSPRIAPRYDAEGLGEYMHGLAADRLTGEALLTDLDGARAA